ncbi:GNAT family N-acetyltransferase [Neptunomonas concharum]|uniref:GNAT family N-acetyltransferase n=1 Tax=Neptunomonas concharum TaxID=1031538 RepID=A0A5P1R6S3_9GAMM|nr:GNAT family N-acetyltransferase [Neptunomonas concharum]QEQ95303.1 GNAT family N-acetyltransferase [Neptunomonas concharum]
MEVRKVKLDEIKSVLILIDEFNRKRVPWPDDASLEEIYSGINGGGGCVVGAFFGEALVGTCTINICPNLSWSGRPYAIIENVVVTSTERNRGIGKALLAFAKKYCQEYGCYKVALMTGSQKPETLHFYESAGFIGSKTGYQARFDA